MPYDMDYSSRVIELIHATEMTTEYTHEIMRSSSFTALTSIPSNIRDATVNNRMMNRFFENKK